MVLSKSAIAVVTALLSLRATKASPVKLDNAPAIEEPCSVFYDKSGYQPFNLRAWNMNKEGHEIHGFYMTTVREDPYSVKNNDHSESKLDESWLPRFTPDKQSAATLFYNSHDHTLNLPRVDTLKDGQRICNTDIVMHLHLSNVYANHIDTLDVITPNGTQYGADVDSPQRVIRGAYFYDAAKDKMPVRHNRVVQEHKHGLIGYDHPAWRQWQVCSRNGEHRLGWTPKRVWSQWPDVGCHPVYLQAEWTNPKLPPTPLNKMSIPKRMWDPFHLTEHTDTTIFPDGDPRCGSWDKFWKGCTPYTEHNYKNEDEEPLEDIYSESGVTEDPDT